VPLNIKSPDADKLARELAKVTGESITDAVTVALRERLARERRRRHLTEEQFFRRIGRIQEEVARWPVLDKRGADEIIGYDEHGAPR